MGGTLKLALAALALALATAQDVGPTPMCIEPFEDAGAINYPSEAAWAKYMALNAAAYRAFTTCMSSGADSCEASLDSESGVASLHDACLASSADGTLCSGWAEFTVNSTVGRLHTKVCLPRQCRDLYDFDHYGLFLARLGVCAESGDMGCRMTSLDCHLSQLGNEGLGLVAGASLAALLLLGGALYFWRAPESARDSAATDALLVHSEEGGSGSGSGMRSINTTAPPAPAKDQPGALARLRQAFDPRPNVRSLWVRSGSSLAPLDGLRAWAVLWVIALHTSIEWPGNHHSGGLEEFKTQMDLVNSTLMLAVNHGNMGVDVFFCLSGFLITFLLLKEKDKTGRIDVVRFLRRRYLRLAPAYLAAFGLVWWVEPSQMEDCHEYWWTNLLFINNMWGLKNCLIQSWSIAIEWQFYLLSPFIVLAMASPWAERRLWRSPNRALLVPAALALYSCGLRLMFVLNTSQDSGNYIRDMDLVYTRMYTRVAPYLSGMGVAFVYSRCKDEWTGDQWRGPVKWLCDAVATLLWVGLTYWGTNNYPESFRGDPPQGVVLGLLVFGRALYGLALCYFMLMTLTGHARVLTWVLSWPVWVPFARLSYSAYLVQFIPITQVESVIGLQDASSQAEAFGVYVALLWVVAPYCFAIAFGVYMLVEKPFMGLRW